MASALQTGTAAPTSGEIPLVVAGSTAIPTAPDGVRPSALSSSSVQITWNDNATDETGYEIQAASLYWGSWTTIATVGPNATSCTQSGLAPGVSFEYRVRALGTDGDSAWSSDNPVFATTIVNHDSQHVIHASTYQDSGGQFYDFQVGIALWQDQSWFKYSNFDLSNDTISTFSVAVAGSGSGDSFEVHMDSPTGALLGTLAIPATADSNTYQTASIPLTAATGTHDLYVVYRTPDWDGHNLRTISFGPDHAPVNSVPGGQVVSTNANLVFSTANNNALSVSDPDDDGNPLKVTLSVSNGTLTLAQTTNLNFLSGDGTGDASMTFTGNSYDLQAALNGLSYAPATNYTGTDLLTLSTDDQGFTGSGGPLVTTDTVALNVLATYVPPPTAPTTPTVNATANSVTIGWTDTSSLETGFQIQRSSGGYVNDWVTVGTVDANVTSYTDLTVSPGAAYKYRVRAFNLSGNSAYTGDWAAVVTTSYPHSLTQPWMLTDYQETSSTGANWGGGMSVNGSNWFRYSNFDFSSAAAAALTVTSEGPLAGNVLEVHLDSITGPEIGTVVLGSGGDYSTAVVSTGSIQATTGVHDIYLVYDDITGWGNLLNAATFGPNQPPVNTLPGAQMLVKNTPLVFSAAQGTAVSISDPDNLNFPAKVTLAASNGTLSLAQTTGLTLIAGTGTNDTSVTVPGALSDVNAALNGLTFTPATGFVGPASLTMTTDDLGFLGSGGALASTDTLLIQVLTAFDPPAAPSRAQASATSSSSIVLIWTNNASNAGGIEIQRTAWGSNSWQTVATVDPSTASYTDTGLGSGTSWQYRVRAISDTGWSSWTTETALATTCTTHSVLSHYGTDLFQAESSTVAAFPGGIGTVADGAWIMFSDFNFSAGATSAFTISLATPLDAGRLDIRIDAPDGPIIGQVQMTSTGSYYNYRNFTGTVAPTTGVHDVYLVFDDGGISPTFLGFTFASNQPPVNAVPATQTVPEDSALTFSPDNGNPIAVSDPDAISNPLSVTLSVTHGTLSLSQITGLRFSTGSGTNDRNMTFTGNQWDITSALAGLRYTPDLHFTGDDTLTIDTNDLGNSGAGGPQAARSSLTIHVPAAVTPPTVATKASANIIPGGLVNLSVLGADTDGEQVLTYVWSASRAPAGAHVLFSTNGTNGAKATSATVDRSGIYTFQVTISDGVSIVTSSVTVNLTAALTVPAPPSRPPEPSTVGSDSHGSSTSSSSSGPPAPPETLPPDQGVHDQAGAGHGAVPTAVTGRPAPAGPDSGAASTNGESVASRESSNASPAAAAAAPAAATPLGPAAAGATVASASPLSPSAVLSASPRAGGTITPADLARIPAPVTAASAKTLDQLVSDPEQVTAAAAREAPALAAEIKKNQQQIAAKQHHVQRVIGTIVGVSATATSACIIWIARGGSLLLSMLTSVPVWRHLDPLPVLDSAAGKGQRRGRRLGWPWRAAAKPRLDATDQRIEQLME